jgi:hypothetical protein
MVNKLFSTVTGTVSLDIRETGILNSVVISAQVPTATTAEVELSFNSTGQTLTNDATGVLASMNLPAVIGGSGHVHIQMNEPVDAGERIYLHTTGSPRCSVTLYSTPTGQASARATVRRR